MKFSIWLNLKEYASPNVTDQQKVAVWKGVWPRLIGNEKHIIGGELYRLNPALFKQITGLQTPAGIQAPQNTPTPPID